MHSCGSNAASEPVDRKDLGGTSLLAAALALFGISALFGFDVETRHWFAVGGVAIGVICGLFAELVADQQARILRPLSLGLVGVATMIDLLEKQAGDHGVSTLSWLAGFVFGLLALGAAIAAIDNGACLRRRFCAARRTDLEAADRH